MSAEYARHSLDDVDLFAGLQAEFDWHVESTQLTPGAYRLEYETINLPNVGVSRLTTRQSVRDYFRVPDGKVVLNIPRARQQAVWSGKRLPPEIMGIYRPGIDHWVVLPAGWDGYELTISENLFRKLEIVPEAFASSRNCEQTCLPLPGQVAKPLVTQLDALFVRARTGPIPETTGFADIIVDGLLAVGDAGLQSHNKCRLDATRRSDLLDDAVALVETRLSSHYSMLDLAAELDVSARVLNYAFKEGLGISPYQYILTRKLHAVRQQIKDSDESIAKIISRHGFATPSRFTRQYRRLFAELPSAARVIQ